jgi:hypothetical protein
MSIRLTGVWLSLLLAGVGVSRAAVTYERALKVAPVRLSQADLMRLIEKLRSLTETANIEAKTEPLSSETLDLSGGDRALSLGAGFSLGDLRRAPATSFSVRYAFRRTDAPIANVELQFYDFERSLRVQGASPDQVDAMVAAFALEIQESTTVFGGLEFRIWAGTLLLVLCFAMMILPQIVGLGTPSLRIWFTSAGFAAILTLWLAPWSAWFAGTAVYAADASFIVRNAASISFTGALVTIAGLVLPILRSVRTRKEVTSNKAYDTAEAPPCPDMTESPRGDRPQQPPEA